MTSDPKISPTLLRELADSLLPTSSKFVEPWDLVGAINGAADRIEELEKDLHHEMVDHNRFTARLHEDIDSLRKELSEAKAAHAEESGRWDEQHARQHAVNTQQAKELFAAKADGQRDYDGMRDFQMKFIRADKRNSVLRETLQSCDQFCRWLSEENKRYRGTEVGSAAARKRIDIEKALAADGEET